MTTDREDEILNLLREMKETQERRYAEWQEVVRQGKQEHERAQRNARWLIWVGLPIILLIPLVPTGLSYF
ncbi:MAG: hypothetical protein AAFX40_02800, partial [Cyanobacteria bacterium J06639_1]